MVAVSLKKFFFKQKTAYEIVARDWSSDVCSSDLYVGSGYRTFARSLNRIFDTIEVQVGGSPYERFY